MRNAYKTLVGKSEEKRPLGVPRRKWEDIIRLDLRALFNKVMNIRFP
jgi:hypothetical protein